MGERTIKYVAPAGVALMAIALGAAAGAGFGLYAFGVVAGAIVLVAASAKPWISISVFIALTSLFGHVSLLAFGDLPNLTVTRLLTIWIVFLAVTKWLPEAGSVIDDGPRRIFIARTTVVVAAIVTLGFFAAVQSHDPRTGIQMYVDQIVVPSALLLALVSNRFDEATVNRVLLVFVGLAVAWSGLALFEFFAGRSLFAAEGVLLWARQAYTRVGGPFVNPAVLGTALGIAFITTLTVGVTGLVRIGSRVAVMLVLAAGLIVTLTRASWIAVLVGILFFGLMVGARGAVAAGLAGMAGVAVARPLLGFIGGTALMGRLAGDSSIFNRVIIYAASLDMVADNPLIGVGIGSFPEAIGPYIRSVGTIDASWGATVVAPHNHLLHVAAEAGVPMMLATIVLWVLIARRLWSHPPASPTWWVRLFGSGILVVYWTNAFFIDMWLTRNFNPIVFVLLGVLCSMHIRPVTTGGNERPVTGGSSA